MDKLKVKKHTCRYRMDRKKSVAGLVHCWFWGSCTNRNCINKIEQKYIEMKDVRRSYNSWYYEPKQEAAHTPIPWIFDEYRNVQINGMNGLDRVEVNGFALSGSPGAKANAAFIVKCVNSYPEMASILNEILIGKVLFNVSDTFAERIKQALQGGN